MRLTYLGVIVSALVAGLTSPQARAQSPPQVFYEQDFARSPALTARHKDVVVLELERGQRRQQKRENLARYQLDAGTHTLCLDGNDPFLTDLILEDWRGRPVLRLHRHRRRGAQERSP